MNLYFWRKDASATTQEKKAAKPKSKTREWWDAVLFAVVAATLIRWLIMEAYTIPTPSMENSLLVGDFLFVSKFHYGTRTTSTPLQVPLTHQKIWFTNIPSYAEWIKLPQYRLPGLTSVKREDVVVFNVPGIEENNYMNPNRETWIDYPVDLKTNYIKRCVGIPGDVLEIRDRQIYANGQALSNPPDMQFRYRIVSKERISERNQEKFEIDLRETSGTMVSGLSDGSIEYQLFLSPSKADRLKAEAPYVTTIELISDSHGTLFPNYQNQYVFTEINWNGDNFGPLWIPKEGETIQVNDSTLTLYGKTILLYDHNKNAEIKDKKLFIDGKEVTAYTFKQNYYFMMGDNRHNSLDSRYWGFVPADHIVGKAFFIWLSLDNNSGITDKIRWNRFFKLIK
jgi:signal peptidase I